MRREVLHFWLRGIELTPDVETLNEDNSFYFVFTIIRYNLWSSIFYHTQYWRKNLVKESLLRRRCSDPVSSPGAPLFIRRTVGSVDWEVRTLLQCNLRQEGRGKFRSPELPKSVGFDCSTDVGVLSRNRSRWVNTVKIRGLGVFGNSIIHERWNSTI